MDSNQFAQSIKQKYPQYASLPNDQLTQMVVKKYPQYAQQITPPTAGMGGVMQKPPAMPQQQQPQQQPQQQTPQQAQQQPFNGIDRQKLLGMYARMDPQGAQQLIGKMMQQQMGGQNQDPLKQAQTDYLRFKMRGGSQGGSDDGMTVYEDSKGNTSIEPFEGAIPIKGVKPSVAVQYTRSRPPTGMGSTPQGREYLASRATQAQAGSIGIIGKDLDPSTASRTSPVGAAASNVRRVVNGLSLLQQPVVTRTALEATLGDIDSILTQGSATVEGRRMLSTPNFQMNVAKFKSYVSSAPDKTPVPPGMVEVYKNILNDLGPISQQFIKQRINNQANAFRKQGEDMMGREGYNSYVKDILNRYDIQAGLQGQGQTQQAPTGGTGQGIYSDPGKEARYQAWKKSQGQ